MSIAKRKWLDDYGKVVGEFENTHGEKFVVYKIKGSDDVFVTGDEMDWAAGYKWCTQCRMLHNDFELSAYERAHLEHILGD